MGVIAEMPKGVKPADVGRAAVYLMVDGQRKPVHDLVQIGDEGLCAGSIFWLEPGREYTVEVELYNRAGGLIAKGTQTGRTRHEPVVPLPTEHDLFVSPSGSDENPGTLEKPLRTVAAGLSRLAPGTTLFIREGLYYEGDLVLPAGGKAGAPVVIRNYNGERAVIDGADPALVDASWQEGPAGTFSAPFEGHTWNVSVEERETGAYYRLYPLRTMDELTSRKSAGKTFPQLGFTGAYHCDGKRIHIVTPGADISEYRVHAATRTRGIVAEGKSFVFMDGIEFRHFGKADYGSAVAITDGSENVIQDCAVYYTNTGVWVKGASNNNTVQDCLFIDDVDHWHFGYSKNDEGWNYHSQIETGAVMTDGRYTGRGLVIRRNRLEGLFDGAHVGPWVEVHPVTSETDFCYNVIDGVVDDFIETDGFSRNVRIFENRMDKSLSGVSLAQGLDGPTWIIYNTINNCGISTGTTLEDYEGYPFKTNGGPRPDIGSGTTFFYHNTAWTSDPKSRAMLVKSNVNWRLFVLYNNIWCGKAMGFDKWSGALSPMDWDYDNLYHAAGPFMKHQRQVFATLDDARKGFGFLEHGISADPRFRDAEGGDYGLDDGSPCIDSGLLIPGINDGRYKGEAPDMGAFESR
jgi:hypothetical protein